MKVGAEERVRVGVGVGVEEVGMDWAHLYISRVSRRQKNQTSDHKTQHDI